MSSLSKVLKKNIQTRIRWQGGSPRLWLLVRYSPEPVSWMSFNDDMTLFLLRLFYYSWGGLHPQAVCTVALTYHFSPGMPCHFLESRTSVMLTHQSLVMKKYLFPRPQSAKINIDNTSINNILFQAVIKPLHLSPQFNSHSEILRHSCKVQ